MIISDAARSDLDGIYDYIAADSPEDAERFVKRFVGKLAQIALTGVAGVARDSIRSGLRMHPIGKYCAYFRVDDANLSVVRIVHSARDIDTIDF